MLFSLLMLLTNPVTQHIFHYCSQTTLYKVNPSLHPHSRSAIHPVSRLSALSLSHTLSLGHPSYFLVIHIIHLSSTKSLSQPAFLSVTCTVTHLFIQSLTHPFCQSVINLPLIHSVSLVIRPVPQSSTLFIQAIALSLKSSNVCFIYPPCHSPIHSVPQTSTLSLTHPSCLSVIHLATHSPTPSHSVPSCQSLSFCHPPCLSFIHSVIHSPTLSFIHPLRYPVIHPVIQSSTLSLSHPPFTSVIHPAI